MSIEVPVLEVFGLADRLRATAEYGIEAASCLRPPDDAGAVTGALGDFLDCFGLAARAMATETDLLGDLAEGVARSWLALDASLLDRRGQVLAR